MRVLLATPIYPPRIGGPAQYVKNLEESLEEKEIKVQVISYNELGKYPQPLRFLFYCFLLLKKAINSDIIYAFNLISSGLPACLIAGILNKKFILRLGGDFLWERAVEAGRTKKPLREYYQEPKTLKEKFWLNLIKIILNSTNKIIFNSSFQRDIYLNYFNLKEKKIIVIPNPFPRLNFKETLAGKQSINYQLLYAGRLLKLKNLDTLIDAFEGTTKQTNKALTMKIIGEGPEKENLELRIKNLELQDRIIFKEPIPHQELLKEIQKSYLCILPSLTEISPNFALECIKLKKPILLTQETGIYKDFKDYLIFIDPQSKNDIENKIVRLLNEKEYQEYVLRVRSVSTSYSWDEVIQKHIFVLKYI